MNAHRKLLSKLFISILILVFMFGTFGLPPLLNGISNARAAGGVAQLTIVTDVPVVRVLVVGINQNDETAEWEQIYSSTQQVTQITTTDWWWRFSWILPGFPDPNTLGPYVWVWYADGSRDNKLCSEPNISIFANNVTCDFPPPPELPTAPDFSLYSKDGGVSLYRNNQQFVQRVSLGLGASVSLLHGPEDPSRTKPGFYGGQNTYFWREPLTQVWTNFSTTDSNAICISNGQFFSTKEDPTPIAFFLKSFGEIVSDGYNRNGDNPEEIFYGQKMMLAIWPDGASMTLLPPNATEAGQILYASSAPHIIVGLTEDANIGNYGQTGRTFIGIADYDHDNKSETILILNSPSSSQTNAANTLRDFGASNVMMLDGGGSTQLICYGTTLVRSSDDDGGGEGRTLPQTIAVSKGPSIPVGSGVRVTNIYHILPAQTINFFVNILPDQAVATFTTTWPGSDVVMTLTSPSGRVINRASTAPDAVHDVGPTFETYTIMDPEPGNWEISLYGADVPPEGEDVTFTFTTGDAAPIPQLAYLDGNTLVLNMGSAERRAARNIEPDEINEEFLVLQLDADKFSVSAFGLTQVYTGATQIEADGNDGNDTITLEAGSVPFTAPADLIGGSGDDVIQSGDGVDTLSGGAGNDEVSGGGGDDSISGDDGDDHLNGQAGQDTINGGGGNDTIAGGSDADILHGDDGNDNVQGEDGADQIYGDTGSDSLYGGTGDDSINGGADNDVMEGGDGADTMHGDDGNDQMLGQADADTLFGDAGDDVMDGGAGADVMEGNDDADNMHGGDENDQMEGNAGSDEMYGDGGRDTMFGNAGNDAMHGGIDDDYMEGNQDADSMFGDEGQDDMLGGSPVVGISDSGDTMSGGADHDVMIGDNGTIARLGGVNIYNDSVRRDVTLFDVQVVGVSAAAEASGNDTIGGDDGDDLIFGQGSDDTLSGGAGNDYLEGNAGADIVNGNSGQDDIIGGGSASDGVIDADRQGDGLLDMGDELRGGDDGDVMTGDNALITRSVDSDGLWLIDPNTNEPVRQVVLFDVEAAGGTTVDPLTSGSDLMFGDAGADKMFGQGNGLANAFIGADPLDGIDNDRNGRESGGLTGEFDCLDGRDNDSDGWIDAFDPQCAAKIDDSPGGDEMHGGDGYDYMEGNHGSDWMFGDDGEDDIIGGSSAGDGFVGGSTLPTGLKDGHDVINGGGEDDVLIGDNAQILRPTDANGVHKRLVGGAFDLPIRSVNMAPSPEITGAFGNDWMSAGDGVDDIYGQLGNDYMQGDGGEDAMVGDLGKITNNLMGINDGIPDHGVQQYIAPIAPFFDPGELIYQYGSLYRQVELYYFVTNAGGAGDDVMYGGEGSDAMHGGAGKDIMNGNGGDDRLFGGDDSDAVWGGPDHDIMFGGYGNDYLDVLPRLERTIKKVFYPADPPTWFEAAMVDNYQGFDTMYGGWDRDWMQADVSAPGRVNGDRMIDWAGGFNAYFRCDGAYGAWVITRQHSPSLVEFLQKLAQGFGAFNTTVVGSSGFRETAIVFPHEIKFNANPPNPDNPAHFTCGPAR